MKMEDGGGGRRRMENGHVGGFEARHLWRKTLCQHVLCCGDHRGTSRKAAASGRSSKQKSPEKPGKTVSGTRAGNDPGSNWPDFSGRSWLAGCKLHNDRGSSSSGRAACFRGTSIRLRPILVVPDAALLSRISPHRVLLCVSSARRGATEVGLGRESVPAGLRRPVSGPTCQRSRDETLCLDRRRRGRNGVEQRRRPRQLG